MVRWMNHKTTNFRIRMKSIEYCNVYLSYVRRYLVKNQLGSMVMSTEDPLAVL